MISGWFLWEVSPQIGGSQDISSPLATPHPHPKFSRMVMSELTNRLSKYNFLMMWFLLPVVTCELNSLWREGNVQTWPWAPAAWNSPWILGPQTSLHVKRRVEFCVSLIRGVSRPLAFVQIMCSSFMLMWNVIFYSNEYNGTAPKKESVLCLACLSEDWQNFPKN